jgi:hypothetical protein
MTSQSRVSTIAPEEYTRRATRSWWTDGFWDLALAGFWLITALWIYPLVRTMAFPSWTWSWPFITKEAVNPLSAEITIWTIALFGIWFVYILLAWLLINRFKRRYVAPRTGDVQHKFFLPVGRGFSLIFLGVYLLGCILLGGLFWTAKGGPRLFDVFAIASFAGAISVLGWRFQIRRYLWMGAIGTGWSVLAELATTNAVYLNGPKNFMDVSPLYGNPTLVCLIWTGILLISGIFSLRRTLSLPHAQG